jgi:hypothetical protein
MKEKSGHFKMQEFTEALSQKICSQSTGKGILSHVKEVILEGNSE